MKMIQSMSRCPRHVDTKHPTITSLSVISFSGKRWLVVTNAFAFDKLALMYKFPLLVSETGDLVESMVLHVQDFSWISFYNGKRTLAFHKHIFGVQKPKKRQIYFREAVYKGLIERKKNLLSRTELRLPRVGDFLLVNGQDANRFGIAAPEQCEGKIISILKNGWTVRVASITGDFFDVKIDRQALAIDGRYHPVASRCIYSQDRRRFARLILQPMSSINRLMEIVGVPNFVSLPCHEKLEPITGRFNVIDELREIKKISAAFWKNHSFFPRPVFSILNHFSVDEMDPDSRVL